MTDPAPAGDPLRRLGAELDDVADPLRAEAAAAEVDADLARLRGRDLATAVRELADRHGALHVAWAWPPNGTAGIAGTVVGVGSDVVALQVDGRRVDLALAHVTAVRGLDGPSGARPAPVGSLLARCRQFDVEQDPVEVWLADGERLVGVVAAAARDHVLLAVDGAAGHVVVPSGAVVAVLEAPARP